MDKAWFHHCLTGLLGPSALRRADLDAFIEIHPSQANTRFVRAIRALARNGRNDAAIAREVIRLPDRSALFRQVSYGELWPIAGAHPEQPSRQVLPEARHGNQASVAEPTARPTALPVYAPPRPQSEVLENPAEDELGHLEDLLFRDMEPEEICLSAPSEASGPAQTPPPPPRKPIMERFDPSLRRQMGSLPARDFLTWLKQIPLHPTSLPPPDPSDNVDDTTAEGLAEIELGGKTAGSDHKKESHKKRKKKKEARKLAKSSIRPSQEVASETLAALLARQGHIDQALDMYQRLMLLIPEKKSIFAGQIAKLKRKEP